MRFVRLWLALMIIVLLAGSVFAATDINALFGKGYQSASSTSSNGLSFGYQKVGSVEVGIAAWRPNFKFGPFGLGLDINAPVGKDKPEGFESIVFRYAEYDDGQKGARYGILQDVTLGHGLLMRNYTTLKSNSIVPNNDDMGLKAYYNYDIYGVQMMSTWSHVYSVRVTEQVYPWLTLGQYYVTDSDGVTITDTTGNKRHFESVSGIGVDATVPIWGGANAYAEAAELIKYGRAGSIGLDWAQNLFILDASFNAEYRVLGRKFVPGYFGPDYETNPVDITSSAATSDNKNGYLVQLKGSILDRVKLNTIYEDYDDSDPSLYAEGLVKFTDQVYVSAYFDQPNFSSLRALNLEEGATQGGTLSYLINPFTVLKTHYKRQYDTTLGKVVETQYYEIELSF